MGIPGILQQLAKSSPMMQQIRQMIDMVNGAQNPRAMINQMLNNNQQMKPVMDAINAAGGDPQKAFYSMAEKMGVDPQEILNMISGR